jgi:hypothetical protein
MFARLQTNFGKLLLNKAESWVNVIHALISKRKDIIARQKHQMNSVARNPLPRLDPERQGLPQSKAESRLTIFLSVTPLGQRKQASRKGVAKPASNACFAARRRIAISRV